MADLSTNIPQISFGQADKETAVNELFDAASPSMLFGRNGVTSAGLNFGIFGGRWNGVAVANKVLALTDNSTLYISASLSTGDATFQTGSFKTGEMPLYKVTTASGLVTNYEDHRAAYGIGIPEAPTDGKQYARKDAGWAEVATSYGDMEAATYDPQGIADDAFDRANHTGTQLMASISDKQGKVFTDPIILSDITDLDGVVDEGLYFCDLSCGVYSGAEVRVYEIVDSVIGLARLQVVSGSAGITQSRTYIGAAWQPFGTSVTDQQIADWYNATTAVAANAVINSDGTFSRSTFDVVAALAEKLDADQVGVANGVASLGADGKVPAAQLPDLSITDTFVVADQVAMLALTAQRGDVAVRSDLNRSFILASEPASTLANWQELLTPTDAVLSVAGKTGAVTLVRGDVGLGNVDNTSDLDKPVSTATQMALNAKAGRVIVLAAVTTSSKTFAPADDMTLTPFTATGAKTAVFDVADGFSANQEISLTNLAASGDLTITPTGITMTPPKGGTLVLEPQDTVTIKFHTGTVAQVIGSTKVA